jgi:hypothetical protein
VSNNKPWYQRVIIVVAYLCVGGLVLGNLLNSFNSVAAIATLRLSLYVTLSLMLSWCFVQVFLRKWSFEWQHGQQRIRIRKLGAKPTLMIVGAIILLWLPHLMSKKSVESERTVPAALADKSVESERTAPAALADKSVESQRTVPAALADKSVESERTVPSELADSSIESERNVPAALADKSVESQRTVWSALAATNGADIVAGGNFYGEYDCRLGTKFEGRYYRYICKCSGVFQTHTCDNALTEAGFEVLITGSNVP